jgi:polysaccharide export outer membrane protein
MLASRGAVIDGIVVKKRFLATLIGGALLASCAGGTPHLTPGEHLTVVNQTELPAPPGEDPNSTERPFHIGGFDRLSIVVFGVPDLSQTVQADSSGRISLPLIGTIEAMGKTPAQLAQEIERRLAGRYVRDPQVSVNLEETVSHVLTVDGQVREPGLYPVIGRMTLMRAIATAKGTTEFARLQDVVVFRTVGEQRMAALYNLQAIRRGLYPDPELFADDVVVVGDSPARRLFRDILQASPLLTTPILALIQNP